MDRNERRLQKAIRRLPRDDRARYGEEWRSDIAAAGGPEEARQVSRGALAMATHLRLRHGGRALFGLLGAGPAVLGWCIVTVAGVGAFLLGGAILVLGLLLAGALVAVMASSGVHTHWSHAIMVGSLVV